MKEEIYPYYINHPTELIEFLALHSHGKSVAEIIHKKNAIAPSYMIINWIEVLKKINLVVELNGRILLK